MSVFYLFIFRSCTDSFFVELSDYEKENQKLINDISDLVAENDSLMKTITSMNIEHKEQVNFKNLNFMLSKNNINYLSIEKKVDG